MKEVGYQCVTIWIVLSMMSLQNKNSDDRIVAGVVSLSKWFSGREDTTNAIGACLITLYPLNFIYWRLTFSMSDWMNKLRGEHENKTVAKRTFWEQRWTNKQCCFLPFTAYRKCGESERHMHRGHTQHHSNKITTKNLEKNKRKILEMCEKSNLKD